MHGFLGPVASIRKIREFQIKLAQLELIKQSFRFETLCLENCLEKLFSLGLRDRAFAKSTPA